MREEIRCRRETSTTGSRADLPSTIPVFPLPAALLLPGGRMPLNIFEPRYLQMIDEAHRRRPADRHDAARRSTAPSREDGEPKLCEVGCLGRITSLTETGDGRYLISLQGVCRFRIVEELTVKTPFRQCRIAPFAADLDEDQAGGEVDRPALLKAFRAYLEANDLEADWDSVSRADNAMLVNALSMMAPYGPAEKQALLEAPDLKTRADTLIAMTEMALARDNEDFGRACNSDSGREGRHGVTEAQDPDRREAARASRLPADQGTADLGRRAMRTGLDASRSSPIRCATASRSCCRRKRAPSIPTRSSSRPSRRGERAEIETQRSWSSARSAGSSLEIPALRHDAACLASKDLGVGNRPAATGAFLLTKGASLRRPSVRCADRGIVPSGAVRA